MTDSIAVVVRSDSRHGVAAPLNHAVCALTKALSSAVANGPGHR